MFLTLNTRSFCHINCSQIGIELKHVLKDFVVYIDNGTII